MNTRTLYPSRCYKWIFKFQKVRINDHSARLSTWSTAYVAYKAALTVTLKEAYFQSNHHNFHDDIQDQMPRDAYVWETREDFD